MGPTHNTAPAHNPAPAPTPPLTNPMPPRGDEHITRAPESNPNPRPAGHAPIRPNPARPSAPPPRSPARPHTNPAAHSTPPRSPSPAPRPTPPAAAHAPIPVNPAGTRPPSATPPPRPSRWKRWFGGASSADRQNPTPRTPFPPPARQFRSNEDGARYGEQTLGPIRDRMSREEFGHAYQYTVNSWINEFLREQRPRDHLNNLTRDFHAQQTLAPLCGPNGWPPSPAYLQDLLNQGRLTPDQRRIARDILGSPDPAYRIESMWSNASRFGAMWRNFGTYPTWDLLNAHCQGSTEPSIVHSPRASRWCAASEMSDSSATGAATSSAPAAIHGP